MGQIDVFSIITLLGGLSFFLYGMDVMTSALSYLAGGRLESLLIKMTSNPVKGVLLGLGVTAVIQSSSAVTVMLVGLVDAEVMSVGQTVGVIMGSNIGTTMTAWLLALTGIEGDNIFIRLLNPDNFTLIFAFVGILIKMMSKGETKKAVGTILLGFAILMFGMRMMSDAVSPLETSPAFKEMMAAFNNPILGVIVGVVITAVIQSSSASVGILQAVALAGGVTYSMAIPIIMGQNIGTCVTALISSIGVSRNARRVAAMHISFNIIGTAVLLAFYCALNSIFNFTFADAPIGVTGIAFVHTVFNVVSTLMLLPFTRLLERILNRIVNSETVYGIH